TRDAHWKAGVTACNGTATRCSTRCAWNRSSTCAPGSASGCGRCRRPDRAGLPAAAAAARPAGYTSGMGTRAAENWLPDFCRTPMLFAAMLIAEGVALAASLAPGSPGFTLGEFATNSLFAIWLTLVGCASLCLLGPWLNRLPAHQGAPLALAMLG